MRKAQKKQAERLAELLKQAHREIEKALKHRNQALALDLLEQCQSAAVELGTSIEEQEGEGFPTVKFLEDYCEGLYQFYEKIRLNEPVNEREEYNALKNFLIQIKNSIQNDISVRTEAVFLPYKASMWDSLESVWRATDEDPDCDAYVVPIPYFDKNPDGSFKEMHYEGDLYPADVPITRYEDYNFEKRQPDMIFIHNPYDEYNYVTSVHPYFYAKNLKQFTEQLIYIPYFVLGEIDPDDEKAVEGIQHFCTVPGVIYADKVIVQSEAMRKVYVNVMTAYAKDARMQGMDRRYWEKKILGLGSPKFDKAVNTRKEDITVPKEWLRVIEKEDGSFKKIIFYNTSVSALLQNGEKMLTKMRDVFRIFKENQEEVALLWRPHPLIQSTVQSMRPELWDEYKEILDQYQREGWGIYDDTPDLDRAIALCDGYYGDGSSVVQLCQKAGVPVMVQDVEIIESESE